MILGQVPGTQQNVNYLQLVQLYSTHKRITSAQVFFSVVKFGKSFLAPTSVAFQISMPTGGSRTNVCVCVYVCVCVCLCECLTCARARSVRVAYKIICGPLVCACGRERTTVLRNDFLLLINCVKNQKINKINNNNKKYQRHQVTLFPKHIDALDPAHQSSTSFATRKTIIYSIQVYVYRRIQWSHWSWCVRNEKKKKSPLLVVITHVYCIVRFLPIANNTGFVAPARTSDLRKIPI